MKMYKKALLLSIISVFNFGYAKSQEIFGGVKVSSTVNFHVGAVPYGGAIDKSFMFMDAREDIFPGFQSTWMFKFLSPDDGEKTILPSHYSGLDIGSCKVGDSTNMFLYPNPFFEEHFLNMKYKVKLLNAKLDEDGAIYYNFRTEDGKDFIIEAYPESWLYKLVLPMEGGFMVYQIVTHKNKLR